MKDSPPASARAAAWLVLVVLLLPCSASARQPLYEGETLGLFFAGHARSLGGLFHIDETRTGGLLPEDIGLSAHLLRLETHLTASDWFAFDVHSRFFLQTTSDPLTQGGGLGVGVTRTPARTLDTRSLIVDRPGVLFEHDLDRLVTRFFFDAADISFGRQAVTWGSAALFPVTDVWTTRAPFDLDTSQKRGVDALRVLAPLTNRLELEMIVVDRGNVSDLSAGARLGWFLDRGDVYAAFGKLWDELALMAGTNLDVSPFIVRGDVNAPLNLDDGSLQLPRVTVGADYLDGDWLVGVEYHFNGAGTSEASEYLDHAATDERLARGEIYLLGQHYAGLVAQYRVLEILSLATSALGNLVDPSVMVTAALVYQVQQDVELSLGALQPFGEAPDLAGPEARSEFGLSGGLYYMQIAIFF